MKFANPDAVIEPGAGSSVNGLSIDCAAERGVQSLSKNGYAVFRIGRLRLGHDESRDVAEQIMRALASSMIQSGAPSELYVEVDLPQTTIMPSEAPTRNMLMHHDGQHSSYLTPSRELVEDWQEDERVFSATGFTTTHTHKLYQGIFISDPGQGLSVTPHVDLVRVVMDAAARQGCIGVESASRWYAANLRSAVRERPLHGSNYPTLAGMLGVGTTSLRGTPLIREEAPVPLEHRLLFPDLEPLIAQCPCGQCLGETLRLFCHVVYQGLGLSASDFKAEYETCLVSEQFDLLVTNNIGSMHAGREGGSSRVLHPFYLTVPRPGGDAYERWLHNTWVSSAAAVLQ
ncbi:hypothetical protein [Paenarthrobacter nitroguajacolicus]|uniref:hypothetical protein n=1 Tax=Paenarthrobacter nitroguajacolicus TaxID=211146 RepID=UPI0015BE3BD8|nr:hypothetical protein [Paenarthrobacter nitroguajacolicus]NWL34714.1 hypothetical protein [Paenarthrobacter nitroguajacolicus]